MIIQYCVIDMNGNLLMEGEREAIDKYIDEQDLYNLVKQGVIIDTEYTDINSIPDDVWSILSKEQKLELDKFFN